MPQEKVNLLGLTRPAMEQFFQSIGEKPFRAQQVMKWIHHRGVDDFNQMTDLGKNLRLQLEEIAYIQGPEVIWDKTSKDGTRKWVIRVESGSRVECVFIPDAHRGTLCVSSQAGCSLDCAFCSTGKQGFDSNLSVAEIIGQLWIAHRAFGANPDRNQRKLTNVVMMGMGEPLLNFDRVIDAMELMKDDLGYGISKRRVTLSTAGVVPNILKLAEITDVSLAISLHAPNDALRNKIVPVNKKYPIQSLLEACRFYLAKQNDSRIITVEYTLIDHINDDVAHAKELATLLQDFPCKINLIPFNPFSLSDFKRPSRNRVLKFQKVLMDANYTATVRVTRGDDIDAACGQLAGEVDDRTKRNARYLAKGGIKAKDIIASTK